jgi:hypothetical protein
MKNGIFVVDGKYSGPFKLTSQIDDHLSVVGTEIPTRSGCGSRTALWTVTNRIDHPKFIAFHVSESKRKNILMLR